MNCKLGTLSCLQNPTEQSSLLPVPGAWPPHSGSAEMPKCNVDQQDVLKNNCVFSSKNALMFFREKKEKNRILVFFCASIYRTLASISVEDA